MLTTETELATQLNGFDKNSSKLVSPASDAELTYALSGRLYFSSSGWVLLSVPNALVRGLFDALNEPGLELPVNGSGQLDAHISVFRPEEVEAIGGPDKITERGHSFTYNLGPLKTAVPAGHAEHGRVWFLSVISPSLSKLRRSYNLSSEPKYPFHLTVAFRRKGVLTNNGVQKLSAHAPFGAGQDDFYPLSPLAMKLAQQIEESLEAAIAVTDTNPTQEQISAGNYRKGKFRFQGLVLALENPKGSVRRGVSRGGKQWETKLKSHYGYILTPQSMIPLGDGGLKDRDGDHVDCFIGPDLAAPLVYVVDQVNPATGRFDEHKVLFGYPDRESASKGYLDNYEAGWDGLGSLSTLTMDQFKLWLTTGDLRQPIAGQTIQIKAADQPPSQPLYQRALAAQSQSPTWDPARGPMYNLFQNLSQAHTRGQEMLDHQHSAESYRTALDRAYGWNQLRGMLAGSVPVDLPDPVDRSLYQRSGNL